MPVTTTDALGYFQTVPIPYSTVGCLWLPMGDVGAFFRGTSTALLPPWSSLTIRVWVSDDPPMFTISKRYYQQYLPSIKGYRLPMWFILTDKEHCQSHMCPVPLLCLLPLTVLVATIAMHWGILSIPQDRNYCMVFDYHSCTYDRRCSPSVNTDNICHQTHKWLYFGQ